LKSLNESRDTVADKLARNAAVVACRKQSARVHNANVKKRITELTSDMGKRHSSYTARATVQHKKLNLPPYPTTTIGSFLKLPISARREAIFVMANYLKPLIIKRCKM
jgi:5-methyltetrahydropteroyltriglutamate--homocysteine methyltransferase